MKRFFLKLISVLLLPLLLAGCTFPSHPHELMVDIIDVDQGDSSLIVTPDNKSILIDAGEEEFSRSVIRDLKKNGVKTIDYMIGSHSDSDHIGAFKDVMEEIDTKNLVISYDKEITPCLQKILCLAQKNNTKIIHVESKDSIDVGNYTRIYILSPEKLTDNPNKNSIVCIVSFDKYNLMFTGDADEEIEKRIIRQYDLPHCDLLKVAHHGSKTSSCEEFVNKISPTIATISCGYKNRYGHPAKDTIDTLTKHHVNIYRTDELGTLKFYFGPDGIFRKME